MNTTRIQNGFLVALALSASLAACGAEPGDPGATPEPEPEAWTCDAGRVEILAPVDSPVLACFAAGAPSWLAWNGANVEPLGGACYALSPLAPIPAGGGWTFHVRDAETGEALCPVEVK